MRDIDFREWGTSLLTWIKNYESEAEMVQELEIALCQAYDQGMIVGKYNTSLGSTNAKED
tara:strand:+ start:12659 stop:12838 length:180 start_codon:yes stop_codon:yes gene_type:complete